ncbi:MAG: hypothetical protein A2Y14_00260 [Verrucomicrobia bacterium GWF2_51_19]|nr:MAG: hypothetical protein A2Y14_00260 [Verrucomicrobia bacterium GWF2_51_19]HCJ11925.1 hypothetical protein [Opitutae bacterium]
MPDPVSPQKPVELPAVSIQTTQPKNTVDQLREGVKESKLPSTPITERKAEFVLRESQLEVMQKSAFTQTILPTLREALFSPQSNTGALIYDSSKLTTLQTQIKAMQKNAPKEEREALNALGKAIGDLSKTQLSGSSQGIKEYNDNLKNFFHALLKEQENPYRYGSILSLNPYYEDSKRMVDKGLFPWKGLVQAILNHPDIRHQGFAEESQQEVMDTLDDFAKVAKKSKNENPTLLTLVGDVKKNIDKPSQLLSIGKKLLSVIGELKKTNIKLCGLVEKLYIQVMVFVAQHSLSSAKEKTKAMENLSNYWDKPTDKAFLYKELCKLPENMEWPEALLKNKFDYENKIFEQDVKNGNLEAKRIEKVKNDVEAFLKEAIVATNENPQLTDDVNENSDLYRALADEKIGLVLRAINDTDNPVYKNVLKRELIKLQDLYALLPKDTTS